MVNGEWVEVVWVGSGSGVATVVAAGYSLMEGKHV